MLYVCSITPQKANDDPSKPPRIAVRVCVRERTGSDYVYGTSSHIRLTAHVNAMSNTKPQHMRVVWYITLGFNLVL
jgi:hypothetical protein